jgi:hypothetical protein
MRIHLPAALPAALPTALLAALLCTSTAARADEGMWLLNELPTAAMQKSLGKAPDAAWVSRVQRGALRLANGCSASFVGKDGLVMTNHHCVRSCLEELSVGGRDLLNKPFAAKSAKGELRCSRFELNQLTGIEDVSVAVLAAVQGSSGKAFTDKLKAEKARLESACSGGDAKVRCDLVTLFDGARFHLYKQRRFQDVRLVLAPEFPMAAFGGDPDNFNFPRTGLDAAFLRVWEDDKPFATTDALPFAKTPAKDGDVVFVAGHPGGTERSRTVAQLAFQRDVALPWTLIRLAELRGRLDEWMKVTPTRAVRGRARLRTVENGLKALRGRLETLARPGFFASRQQAEEALKRGASPEGRQAFLEVEEANARAVAVWGDHRLLEAGEAFMGDLFGWARLLVRAEVELGKDDATRLPEYTSARLPALRQQLATTSPVVIDEETALLSWSLHRLRNLKGMDDPVVAKLLGTTNPDRVAAKLVKTTRLKDRTLRLAAFDGDEKARAVLSKDPLIAFARLVDDDARAARAAWENEVEAKETAAAERLAGVRRAARAKSTAAGTSTSTSTGTYTYPDATFTLRLSYGRVQGPPGHKAMTTISDLLARAGDDPPFRLSPSWQRAALNGQSKLDPTTPMNVSTTNDIIGGNSGSPLLNEQGEVVGLIFDGNLASLGGRYVYEPETNRAVAVHGEAIRAALTHVYDGRRVLEELDATRAAQR